MGGLVRFPRSSARQTDAEWHDPAETSSKAMRSNRKAPEASIVTWSDATRLHDGGDDDNDGGGAAA